MSEWLDELLSGVEFERFLASVEAFCSALDRLESLPKADFLREMDRLLPQVYSAAAVLPDYPWDEEDDDTRVGRPVASSLALQHDMYQRVETKLGALNVYRMVFDPVNRKDEDPIDSTLSDDLASVYAELKEPLEHYRSGEEAEIKQALWDWGFGRKIHWGRHAVHAMGAIYALVHQHYDEDQGFDIEPTASV